MAHTLHTTANHMRQPVAIKVRSMEASFVSAAWGSARSMREAVYWQWVGMRWHVFGESDDSEVAEFRRKERRAKTQHPTSYNIR